MPSDLTGEAQACRQVLLPAIFSAMGACTGKTGDLRVTAEAHAGHAHVHTADGILRVPEEVLQESTPLWSTAIRAPCMLPHSSDGQSLRRPWEIGCMSLQPWVQAACTVSAVTLAWTLPGLQASRMTVQPELRSLRAPLTAQPSRSQGLLTSSPSW